MAKSLDLSKLNLPDKLSDEYSGLDEIVPMDIPEEVLTGEKKLVFRSAYVPEERHNICLQYEIQ